MDTNFIKMDIIGELPIEIAHTVISYLSLEDVLNCAAVSKKWCDVINSEHVWFRFYKYYRLYELNYSSKSKEDSLAKHSSKMALVKQYLNKLFNNWKTGNWAEFLAVIKYPTSDFLHLYNGRQVAIFYRVKCELELLTVTNEGLHNKTLSLYFSQNLIKLKHIRLNQDYIAVSAFNIIYIVKQLGDGELLVERCYASVGEDILKAAESDFEEFVSVNINTNSESSDEITNIEIIDGILWVSCKHFRNVINLSNNKFLLVDREFPFFSNLSPTSFLCFSDIAFVINDQYGSCLSKTFVVHKILKLSDIFSNGTWMIIPHCLEASSCRAVTPGTSELYIYTISGLLKGVLSELHVKKCLIHPTKGILYMLIFYDTLYKLKAVNLETKETIWETQLKRVQYRQRDKFDKLRFLSLIHNVFILAYPGPSSRSSIALFNLKGELLFEKPVGFIPNSSSVTGDLMVSKQFDIETLTSEVSIWKFF